MATQKQKDKKRKDREKVVKAKILSRRESLRKERKKESDNDRREQAELVAIHGKPKPYRKNTQQLSPEQEAERVQTVKNQLENNLKILEALEQEYEAEQTARSDTNAGLEAEGHMTMREKMDALHQKALEATGKAEELAAAKNQINDQQS